MITTKAPPGRSLHLVVHTTPVGKPRPRAGFRGGKVINYTPTKSKHAEWEIRQEATRLIEQADFEKLGGPIAAKITAYLPRPASHTRRQREVSWVTTTPDFDNLAKTVADALEDLAFKNDSQWAWVRVEKRYADDGPPRWDIQLWEIGGAAP